MKILSSAQTREIDNLTIKEEGIPSVDLMERAANAFTQLFVQHYNNDESIHIFCGPGNNGGDGLAIARLIYKLKYDVNVYILDITKNFSQDFKINRDRLNSLSIPLNYIFRIEDFPKQIHKGVIIDGLFGSGLSRNLEGFAKSLVEYLNQQNQPIVSIDIPSGMFADQSSTGVSINANKVYSFQLPKLAFLLPENENQISKWYLVDIGLSLNAIASASCNHFFVTEKDVQPLFIDRNKFSHKGTFGHLLLIAGSEGKIGAAILSAKAAMRSGTGLLTTFLSKKYIPTMQMAFPEAMCWSENEDKLIESIAKGKYNSIAIGPGLGLNLKTSKLFAAIIKATPFPIVVDADGINILAKNPQLLHELPSESILTPHPGEFKRLVGEWKNDFEKLKMLQEFALKYQLNIVLKGAYTCICDTSGKYYFNSTGNNGMATAGSGDTLTGIIAGLLAQNYPSKDAAILGVYLHGLAGDLTIKNSHPAALIASDISSNLGAAFAFIDKRNN